MIEEKRSNYLLQRVAARHAARQRLDHWHLQENTQYYCFNVSETEKARTYQLAGGVATESSHQAKARRLGLPTTNPSYPDTSSSRSSQRAATATSLQR